MESVARQDSSRLRLDTKSEHHHNIPSPPCMWVDQPAWQLLFPYEYVTEHIGALDVHTMQGEATISNVNADNF